MDRLIPVTNQIREALASASLDLGIDLPQIAVVGGQSVGKSSLLEALVGRAFLPTGTGVVTRRPLILQLIHRSEDDSEWGEFSHLPGRRLESFDDIREEIVRETNRLCGQRQGVSAHPIVLQITSPRLITLTLVDLPGIARVPVGDQPQDIEQQIRQLVMSHISSPRCLILAVAAANADLATADSLALAREVDPEGERTIGVLTKMDLADHAAAEAAAVLEGQVYPLKLGFVGVTCRNRAPHESNDLSEQLRAEETFFKSNPAYRAVVQHCGIGHLARHLNRILLDRICEVFPSIRAQALQMMHDLELELQGLGEPFERRTPGEQGALLLSLFARFAGRFGDAVEGKRSTQPLEVPGAIGQLVGRARIDYIFRDVFAKTVRDFDSFNGLSDDDIRIAIRNATGPRATLFVPEAAFELLVRRQIAKLQAPSLQCADLVFDELQRVLVLSELPEFRRFVRLREQVFTVVRDILRLCLEPTAAMIRDLIAVEMAYINTSHPDFVSGSGAIRSASSGAGRAAQAAESTGHGSSGEEPKLASGTLQATAGGSVDVSAAEPSGGSTPSLQSSSSTSNLGGGFLSALGLGRRQNSGTGRAQSPPATPALEARQVAPYGGFGSSTSSTAPSASLTSTGGPKLPHIPPSINPAAEAPGQRERMEVNIIKTLMDKYLTLVKKNVADSVPKAIMFFLVGGAGVCGSDPDSVSSLKDAIQSECVTRLYKEELFDELLCENLDVKGRREKCRERLEALRRVIKVTEHVRDVLDSL